MPIVADKGYKSAVRKQTGGDFFQTRALFRVLRPERSALFEKSLLGIFLLLIGMVKQVPITVRSKVASTTDREICETLS